MQRLQILKTVSGILLCLWIIVGFANPNTNTNTNTQTNPNSPPSQVNAPIANVNNNSIVPLVPQAPIINAKSYVLMDANSGAVLASSNMNQPLPPASLTKLMTAYVTSASLKQGQIKPDDMVTISEKAWRQEGSRMFIKVGSQVSVRELLGGIIVASGNDSCVAIAEHIAGSEDVFAQLMNQNAARLGMKNTHYTDSTGLPNDQHYSTAYDIALLSRAIISDFPEDYTWYKQKWVLYNNIRQPNRNRLLWRDPSVDGLKTGHTDAAGYCLVSSALRNGIRLIAVVMGAPSDAARTDESQILLNWGYRFFETHKLFNAGQTINQKNQPRIWFGKNKYAKLGFIRDTYVTIPINQFNKLQANIQIQPKLMAPLIKGQRYGSVQISLDGKPYATLPIVALEDDQKGGIFSRGYDHVMLFLTGWMHRG